MKLKEIRNEVINKLLPEDAPVHDWYRFVLSFPPHLVRSYLNRFDISPKQRVLDPFCGTGTTIVECKKLGIPSVGIEASPMAQFASKVKCDWTPNTKGLISASNVIYEKTSEILEQQNLYDTPNFFDIEFDPSILNQLSSDKQRLILTNSISPKPLHKALTLLEQISLKRSRYIDHQKLAFAKALVADASNLHFGPEVGVRKAKDDAPILGPWLDNISQMACDLDQYKKQADVPCQVVFGDARNISEYIQAGSIDFVFTSPPYPNEKDYTRTTRLESVILGFINTMAELRGFKKGLLRSNTRNVYKTDDDDAYIGDQHEIHRIAEDIENRRKEMGKTSGFERLYHRVTKLYFGGMARHFEQLRPLLKPGAVLAYVVGDQASYLRVMIRTGKLLADIAESLGYEVIGIDLFRTRLATATKEQLNEEVLLLRWKG